MKKLAMTQEKTASLMMLVMFLMIVFIGACATTPATRAVWSKPNAAQQDFAKDMDDCMKKAQATGSASTNVDMYNRCMETRGLTLKEVKSVSESSGITERYTFADGTRYEGTMANGKPHGRGTYNWTNGNKYEGDWFEGKMSGKGKYTCKNGREFTGNFENNKPVGFTINCSGNVYYVPDSRQKAQPRHGSYTDANGNKYEGQIINGKLHGKGKITSPSGNKYEGDFVNGKIEGRGTYTCSTGKTFTGYFKNNKPVGFKVKCK